MRSTYIALLLMLAAAAVAIHGGARLADVYEEHLSRIATGVEPGSEARARELCASAVGIRSCAIFSTSSAARSLSVQMLGEENARVPELAIEGGKQPLNRATAAIVPAEIFNGGTRRGWLRPQDAVWRVYWQHVADGRFVVLLVEAEKVRRITEEHLAGWLPPAFAPLRESGELVSVRGLRGVLAGVTAAPQAPIALTVPLRNALGTWEISAWDRLTTHTAYEPATLAVAITGGALLAAFGVILFRQQRRALRLAEERVSFVNRVSHELGTPLTNVLLNLSLADDALDAQPARARAAEARH